MIVYFGTRHCGAVATYRGEYAATRVFHVYWLPIVPLGSMWVTGEIEDGLRGYKIPLHWGSLLAAYLRSWGLVIAVALVVNATRSTGGELIGSVAAVLGLMGLVAWSWRQHELRDPRAQRGRDLARSVLGVSCEPRALPAPMVSALQARVEDAWAADFPDRTPGDTARLGPESPEEAALAYGLLRLRAATGPRREVDRLEEQAARIVNAVHDRPALAGHPYREITRALDQEQRL